MGWGAVEGAEGGCWSDGCALKMPHDRPCYEDDDDIDDDDSRWSLTRGYT